jgi:serine/threonine-protein kinase
LEGLRREIAALLSEHGRIPPAEAERMVHRAADAGLGEAAFWAEVDDIAASNADLAAKRRLVTALRNRAQLTGGDFDVDATVDKLRAQANSAGWSDHELRAIAEEIRDEIAPSPAPAETKRRTGLPWRRSAPVAAIGVVALALAGFVLYQWGSAPRPIDRFSAGKEAAGGDELRAALEDVRYVAAVDGALGPETRRLLERLEDDPDAGPQTLALLRRAVRDAEPLVWSRVAQDPTRESIERFIDVYPDGRFAGEAAGRLARLREAGARSELIVRVQRELVRLGRNVEVSGELDDRTREELQVYAAATTREQAPDVTAALIDELAARQDWPRRPGEVFRDCAVCPEMVVVPAGRFMMGSPDSDTGSEANEQPVHEVRVPRFAIGRTEVTFDQWLACVADGGCDFMPPDAGWGQGSRPVINIAWSDALGYLRWLSRKTGHRYRLPSEAEWEYAARAGTSTRFHTGRCITSEQANFDGRRPAMGCPESEVRRQTLPVASFAPNDFGIHDMAGNVREWVRDCWNDNYLGAPDDGSAWMSGDCSRPVLRGGSWARTERMVRAANRTRPSGAFNDTETGFRPARDLE